MPPLRAITVRYRKHRLSRASCLFTFTQQTRPMKLPMAHEHCMLWAKLRECDHNAEAMRAICRPACVTAQSGHLPMLPYALHDLMTIPPTASVELKSDMTSALCTLSHSPDQGASWMMDRPSGLEAVDQNGMVQVILITSCIKYELRADGQTRIIKANSRTGVPRVSNPQEKMQPSEEYISWQPHKLAQFAQLLLAKRFTPLESFIAVLLAVCAFVATALMRHRIANPASGSLGSKRIAQGKPKAHRH